MTNKEKQLINSWNQCQTVALAEAHKSYAYVLSKYEDLSSRRIFCVDTLICEIVKSKRVGENQRAADLNTVIKYLLASGQVEAVESFLDLGIG